MKTMNLYVLFITKLVVLVENDFRAENASERFCCQVHFHKNSYKWVQWDWYPQPQNSNIYDAMTFVTQWAENCEGFL